MVQPVNILYSSLTMILSALASLIPLMDNKDFFGANATASTV